MKSSFISSRGFNSDVANKLLVLIDGRTVYTPLFSGVFWDRQNYVLADIDRIESISGPGGFSAQVPAGQTSAAKTGKFVMIRDPETKQTDFAMAAPPAGTSRTR